MVVLDGMHRKVSAWCWACYVVDRGESVSPAFLLPDPQGAGEAGTYSPLPWSELGWALTEEKKIAVQERLGGPE